jgi:hypothetical protein
MLSEFVAVFTEDNFHDKPLPKSHFPFENQQEAFVRAWNANE